MKGLPIAVTVLLCALTIAGQIDPNLTVSDFPRMVNQGLKVMARGPHRYKTNFEGNKTVTLEVDAKGSIRTKSYNSSTRESGECVIIGGRIYHRSGNGPWISQTKDEFDKAQVTISAAMREARAKKDEEAFIRLRAATLNNTEVFYALWRPGPVSPALIYPSDPNLSGRTVEFIGDLPYTNKTASFYRLRGNTTAFKSPAPELRAMRVEIMYAFNKETGALLSAQMRTEWVYESKTNTFSSMDEWESDPSIVIAEPPVTTPKQ